MPLACHVAIDYNHGGLWQETIRQRKEKFSYIFWREKNGTAASHRTISGRGGTRGLVMGEGRVLIHIPPNSQGRLIVDYFDRETRTPERNSSCRCPTRS